MCFKIQRKYQLQKFEVLSGLWQAGLGEGKDGVFLVVTALEELWLFRP